MHGNAPKWDCAFKIHGRIRMWTRPTHPHAPPAARARGRAAPEDVAVDDLRGDELAGPEAGELRRRPDEVADAAALRHPGTKSESVLNEARLGARKHTLFPSSYASRKLRWRRVPQGRTLRHATRAAPARAS